MNILIKTVITLVTVSFSILYAGNVDSHAGHNHEGHGHSHSHNHGIKSESIQKIAEAEVQRLVLEKKIAKSWASIPIAKIGRTHQSNIDDWIVAFENPKMKKKSKRTLYIFVSKVGNITGANYTGK